MNTDEIVEKIRCRQASLERKFGGLTTRLRDVSLEEFLRSEMLQEFAFARLYKTMQDVQELSNQLSRLAGCSPEQKFTARLRLLEQHGIIDSELSAHLVTMADFFNMLSDACDEIDSRDLFRVATEDVSRLEAFSKAITAYLEQIAF